MPHKNRQMAVAAAALQSALQYAGKRHGGPRRRSTGTAKWRCRVSRQSCGAAASRPGQAPAGVTVAPNELVMLYVQRPSIVDNSSRLLRS